VGKLVGKVAKAFTIVELLIVIVVIGILAAITIVGYGAVTNNATDVSVKSDLQKIDDAFKQYSLDNGGTYPDTIAELATLNLKLNKDSYFTGNKANVYICTNPTDTEYAAIAMAKSGKRFMVKSESGISDYNGGITWDPVTANWATTCSSVDPTYAPLSGNITGMEYTVWKNWTGVNGTMYTNLATNPSMESDIGGWSLYLGVNAPTRSTTTPACGTARLSAVGNNTAVTPRVVSATIAASPGDQFTVSAKIRSDGQVPTDARLTVKAVLGASETSTISYNAPWNPGGDGWMQVSTTITVPSGANGIRINPGLNTSSNYAGTLGVDCLMVIKGSTGINYADGNSTNWSWDGTVNSSTSTGPAL